MNSAGQRSGREFITRLKRFDWLDLYISNDIICIELHWESLLALEMIRGLCNLHLMYYLTF